MDARDRRRIEARDHLRQVVAGEEAALGRRVDLHVRIIGRTASGRWLTQVYMPCAYGDGDRVGVGVWCATRAVAAALWARYSEAREAIIGWDGNGLDRLLGREP